MPAPRPPNGHVVPEAESQVNGCTDGVTRLQNLMRCAIFIMGRFVVAGEIDPRDKLCWLQLRCR
jgi:hypothetical protein